MFHIFPLFSIVASKAIPSEDIVNLSASLRCNGQDNGCCTRDKPCDLGEGDCDRDDHCMGGLTCGHDNCPWGDGDDCCQGVKAPSKYLVFSFMFD